MPVHYDYYVNKVTTKRNDIEIKVGALDTCFDESKNHKLSYHVSIKKI